MTPVPDPGRAQTVDAIEFLLTCSRKRNRTIQVGHDDWQETSKFEVIDSRSGHLEGLVRVDATGVAKVVDPEGAV